MPIMGLPAAIITLRPDRRSITRHLAIMARRPAIIPRDPVITGRRPDTKRRCGLLRAFLIIGRGHVPTLRRHSFAHRRAAQLVRRARRTALLRLCAESDCKY